MLDTSQPQTACIFAAARHEDMILDACKQITLCDAFKRRYWLEIILPSFAALRWLNCERFGNSPEIASGIDQLERGVRRLVDLPISGSPDPETGTLARCPACRSEPRAPDEYDSIRYCSTCLDIIMPALSQIRSWDTGFGTDGI